MDIETIGAKLEIQELQSRYAWAVDEGRIDRLADLFAEDARLTLTPGGVDRKGRDAVLDWYREYCHDWGWRNRRHYMANVQVEVEGAVARCRAYFLLTYEVHGKSRIGWGNYEDRFVQREGRWWIGEKNISSAGPVSLDKGWAGLEALISSPEWR